VLLTLLTYAVTLAACTRDETPQPIASPVATLTPAASAAPPIAASPAAAGAASPVAAADGEDFEWNLEDEPEGTEFEIDADATSYYMPLGNVVTFKAKALNGTPPFTFSWDFGDGAPPATGELVKHTYDKLGRFDAFVTGTDASGTTSTVQLGLLVDAPQDWVKKLGLDPKVLESFPSPSPDPAPAVTP